MWGQQQKVSFCLKIPKLCSLCSFNRFKQTSLDPCLKLSDITELDHCVAQTCWSHIQCVWGSVLVLRPWGQVLWFVKQEVRVTIVIIPEPVESLDRKKRLDGEISQKKQSLPWNTFLLALDLCPGSSVCTVLFETPWLQEGCCSFSCVSKSILGSRTGVMVPRIRLVIEGSKITLYF